MGCTGPDALGTRLLHDVGSLGDGACGINHVVDDDDVLVFHIADDLHALHHVGPCAGLVAEHERAAQVFGVGVGALAAAHVGRCDNHVFELEALQIGQDDARGIQVVNGYIEEALYLVGMKVHGDQAVNACHAQQVGHQFGTDAHTGFVLAVLACPAEVGHHGIDGFGRCALGGVDHEQQFHEVVRIGERALHEEHVASADRLLVGHGKLSIGEFRDEKVAQWAAQTLADFLCQIPGVGSREHHE